MPHVKNEPLPIFNRVYGLIFGISITAETHVVLGGNE